MRYGELQVETISNCKIAETHCAYHDCLYILPLNVCS